MAGRRGSDTGGKVSENLIALKSYLQGEGGGKGTYFVTRVNVAQLGRTLGEAVLHPRDLPFGHKAKLVVILLLDSEDVAYASEKCKDG
jgi:hypothetical protein